jgi:peptide/nickel transport system permease protein
MTPLTPEQPALARVAPGRGARRVTTLSVGTVLAVILLLAALFAPWLAPFDPNIQHIEIRLMPPSAQHWLGTDGFGRDLLSRVIYGARPTLLLVSLILLLTIPFGLLIGISAGYLGGWVERILMRFTDIVLSLPSLVMALALVAILGPGLMNGALALAFTSWPPFARQARAETLALRRSDYLAAARMPDVWPYFAALHAECGRSRRAEPRRDHSFLRRSWLPRDGHSAADRRVGVDGRRRQ